MQTVAVADPILIEKQVRQSMTLFDDAQGKAIGRAGRLGTIGRPRHQQGEIETHIRTPAHVSAHSTPNTKKPLLGGALRTALDQT